MGSIIEPGQLVAERFVVEKVLGRGNFGTTFAARDQESGNKVAVKEHGSRRRSAAVFIPLVLALLFLRRRRLDKTYSRTRRLGA